MVTYRKVFIMELDLILCTIVKKSLNGRFQQTDTTVITVKFDITNKTVDRLKTGLILFAGKNFQLRAFIQNHFRRKIAERKGNRFARNIRLKDSPIKPTRG